MRMQSLSKKIFGKEHPAHGKIMSLNTTELQTFFKQSLESDIKSKRSYSNKFKNSGDS